MSEIPKIPADKPLEEILDLLLDQVRLPRVDAQGRAIRYRIIHKKSNRVLDLGLSFIDQGVSGNDQLVFQRIQH